MNNINNNDYNFSDNSPNDTTKLGNNPDNCNYNHYDISNDKNNSPSTRPSCTSTISNHDNKHCTKNKVFN